MNSGKPPLCPLSQKSSPFSPGQIFKDSTALYASENVDPNLKSASRLKRPSSGVHSQRCKATPNEASYEKSVTQWQVTTDSNLDERLFPSPCKGGPCKSSSDFSRCGRKEEVPQQTSSPSRQHFCRSPRCAANNPDYAVPVQVEPRKYLISKRHLVPGAICTRDAQGQKSSPSHVQRNIWTPTRSTEDSSNKPGSSFRQPCFEDENEPVTSIADNPTSCAVDARFADSCFECTHDIGEAMCSDDCDYSQERPSLASVAGPHDIGEAMCSDDGDYSQERPSLASVAGEPNGMGVEVLHSCTVDENPDDFPRDIGSDLILATSLCVVEYHSEIDPNLVEQHSDLIIDVSAPPPELEEIVSSGASFHAESSRSLIPVSGIDGDLPAHFEESPFCGEAMTVEDSISLEPTGLGKRGLPIATAQGNEHTAIDHDPQAEPEYYCESEVELETEMLAHTADQTEIECTEYAQSGRTLYRGGSGYKHSVVSTEDDREVVILRTTPQKKSGGQHLNNDMLEEAIAKFSKMEEGRVPILVKAFESLMCLQDTTGNRASRVWCFGRAPRNDDIEENENDDESETRYYEVVEERLRLLGSSLEEEGTIAGLSDDGTKIPEEEKQAASINNRVEKFDSRQFRSVSTSTTSLLTGSEGAQEHRDSDVEMAEPGFQEPFHSNESFLQGDFRAGQAPEDTNCGVGKSNIAFGGHEQVAAVDSERPYFGFCSYEHGVQNSCEADRPSRWYADADITVEDDGSPRYGGYSESVKSVESHCSPYVQGGIYAASERRRNAIRATMVQPFRLLTEERGLMKEFEFAKKLEKMFAEEERLRIPLAQGLPWTTDEPQVIPKPPVKEQTKPVEFRHYSNSRAIERAEYDHYVAERISYHENQKQEEERRRQIAEQEEIKRLRREMVPKAQLMPYFDQPFIPGRSTKRLTIPKEPSFHQRQYKRAKCMTNGN